MSARRTDRLKRHAQPLSQARLEWTEFASQLDGDGFAVFQRELTKYNRRRLEPSLPSSQWRDEIATHCRVTQAEGEFVEAVRARIRPLASDIPSEVEAFVAWFERLRASGPGQADPLFPWLETTASLPQMKWFIEQEVAGEAGFDDLLALTQVKMPQQAKLEMARNYWDEMGRGAAKGMHGPMLEKLARHLDVHPTPESVIPEALALGNMMIALAHNRRYAWHSVGALGVIEMTAPTRAGYVDRGLRRLAISGNERHYFALHAVLDVKHSETWNREILRSLVAEEPRRAQAIGEGALLRLWHGACCFTRYRERFAVPVVESQAA
jgi:Iron-containing redox enzyme